MQIIVRNNLSFDKIDDVVQSYLGYLSGEEYLKVIVDNHGDIRTRVFYENVRDYQGERNPVNQEIHYTLTTPSLRDKLALLNNSITIVTKHFKPLGSNMFKLREFQFFDSAVLRFFTVSSTMEKHIHQPCKARPKNREVLHEPKRNQ